MEVTLRTCQSVPFYACGGFDPSVCAHGFSTRLGGVSPAPWDSLNLGANRGDAPERVAENFRRFCSAAGADPAALVKNHQVHGDLVRPVTRRDVMSSSAEPGVYEADGLITDEPGLCLTIFSADCIPVLLLDPVRRCAAARIYLSLNTQGNISRNSALFCRHSCRNNADSGQGQSYLYGISALVWRPFARCCIYGYRLQHLADKRKGKNNICRGMRNCNVSH